MYVVSTALLWNLLSKRWSCSHTLLAERKLLCIGYSSNNNRPVACHLWLMETRAFHRIIPLFSRCGSGILYRCKYVAQWNDLRFCLSFSCWEGSNELILHLFFWSSFYLRAYAKPRVDRPVSANFIPYSEDGIHSFSLQSLLKLCENQGGSACVSSRSKLQLLFFRLLAL